MNDNVLRPLMLKFLKENYPVTRIKDHQSKRFKRGIVGEEGRVFFISNPVDYYNAQTELLDSLINVFNSEVEFSFSVLKEFLNLE